MICSSLDINIRLWEAIRICIITALFTLLPVGALGTDAAKVWYLRKNNYSSNLSTTILAIGVDRIIGLLALIINSSVACFILFLVGSTAVLNSYNMVILSVLLVAIVFISISFFYENTFFVILKKVFPVVKIQILFDTIQKNIWLLKSKKTLLLKALFIGIILHLINAFCFYYLYTIMLNKNNFLEIFAIHPIGMLTTVIPITPAGLGVGHMAFDQLFILAGLGSKIGANLFNIHIFGFLTLNVLFGSFFYLFMKKTMK